MRVYRGGKGDREAVRIRAEKGEGMALLDLHMNPKTTAVNTTRLRTRSKINIHLLAYYKANELLCRVAWLSFGCAASSQGERS